MHETGIITSTMYASGDDISEHRCNFDLAFLLKWPTINSFIKYPARTSVISFLLSEAKAEGNKNDITRLLSH